MKRNSLLLALGTVAAWAGVASAAVMSPRQAAFSYLTAFAYWLSICLGALFVLFIGVASNARWFVVIRRLTEFVAATIPIFLLLFVPIAFWVRELYPWAGDVSHMSGYERELLEHKRIWLNVPAFLARSVGYFAVWICLMEILFRRSVRQDREGAEPHGPRLRPIGAVALPIVALTLTFAAFDWYMSLEPLWYSSIYGLYYFAGGFVSALAWIIVSTWRAEKHGPLQGKVNPDHYYALGRLLFAFVIFWAYIAFSQLLVIWMGDLPEDISWYQTRLWGSWGAVALVILLAKFVVPFFLLLSWRLKHRPQALAAVAIWILAAHYVDVYWVIVPARPDLGFSPHWADLCAWIAVGGVVRIVALWRAQGKASVAQGDPGLSLSVRYHSP